MKKFIKCFIFIFALLVFPYKVFASYDAIINGNDVRIRVSPGTESSILATVNMNTPIILEDKTLYSGTGCSDKWYKIIYNSMAGYVCSTYVVFKTELYSGINVVDWTARVNTNNITVRNGASVDTAAKEILSLGVNVTILSTENGSNKNCSGGLWYRVSYYSNSIGYVCSNLITKKSDITDITIADDYKNYLISQNFPESYWPFLNYLHIKYPNWIFRSGNTGVSFPAAVSGEEGKNGMQTTNNNYRTSTTPYDGSSWFRINSGVTAFYMDPRNWLTEGRIFMFEKLDYSDDLESQYPVLVKSVFGTGTLADDIYTIPMVNAGKTNRISPVHIASRIKQEVSANGSGSTNGGEFTWKGQTYSGFYNFFNIGAYASTVDGIAVDAVLRGRLYAAKLIPRDGSLWNNIEVSITEGSSFLANGYINKDQGTLYYQKFNIGPNAYNSKYTHQYMTNVQAPASEGNSTYNSYKNSGVLDQLFIFEIPIFSTNNFPSYTSLPKSGNTDNNLASLEVEGFPITPSFDKDVITYDSYVTKSIDKININATTSSSLASISGSGEILLTSDENVITIVVKSEAGEEKNYTINVHKVNDSTTVNDVLLNAPVKVSDTILSRLKNSTTVDSLQTLLIKNGAKGVTFKNSSGVVITGNKVIGTNSSITITTTTETKTFVVSVSGDTSGDGKVTILDLLEVQKHIKGASTLSGAALDASDTSGDSKTTILDLLEIVKHIKGASPL